jgi:gamma-polyglutamate synthase
VFIASALTVFAIGMLALEAISVRRSARAIAVRVHVNGTRGKSTVVSYIAAALRASGRRTFAKITGTRPTLLLPDGGSEIIRRRGPARVQEQFGTMRRAARAGAECLVLECMSIDPELQRLESRFFDPDISVITNIRDDHAEAMGRTTEERTEAILSAIPRGGVVVAGPCVCAERLAVARTKGSRVILTGGAPDRRIGPLPDGVFEENVAIACAAAEAAGVDFDTALRGILDVAAANPARPLDIAGAGRVLRFVDGFAVNDVESAERFVEYWRERLAYAGEAAVLLNTRSDRPTRTLSFAKWLAAARGVSRVIVTGSHAGAAKRALLKEGVPAENVLLWTGDQARRAAALLPGPAGLPGSCSGSGTSPGPDS